MFNTNTLGYKLVTSKLKKHSEQLNKYVAGLFDADGCISLERVNKKYIHIRFTICQNATVDQDFELLRSLKSFYKLGTLKYSFSELGISRCDWRLSTRESKIIFNLFGKHLRIKGTHFKNLIDIQERYTGKATSDEEWETVKEFSKESRKNSKWLKYPKHLSYAWVSGYLDGDGHYSFRKSQNTLSIRVPSSDFHILEKLQEDFKGSVYDKDSYKIWRRGLGKGHIKFSLPFLKKMRMYSCLRQKYNKIQEMLSYLENSQVAKTNQTRFDKNK